MKEDASGGVRGARQQRVTSADVARASGVSRATVSYVLNNDPRQTIPAETRERVERAARALGYSPFAPARILRVGQSQLVLAVLPFEQIDPALALRLKELEQGLAAHGMTLICYVGVHPQRGGTHPSAHVTPSVLLSYADPADPQIAAFLQEFHVPILHLLADAATQEEAGRVQATHLLQRGKRSLIFAGSEREDTRALSERRLSGVRQVCAQQGLAAPGVCTIPASRERARSVLRDTFAEHPVPCGICCYNDEVALAVLAALADLGIAVPAGAAVIGCDNIPLAQFSLPALTSIALDDKDTLDPLIETIIALSRGEAVHWIPQKSVAIVQRASA